MKNFNKKLITLAMTATIVLANITSIFAQVTLPLEAKSAILIEEKTGKVLFQMNENERVYPASTTKILTALVAMDYLKPGEIVIVGDEINSVPFDSSKAGNKINESLSVENLMRLLIIPSGNETSNVIAREVARRSTGDSNISFANAENVFSQLMNEKAKSLGANDSNFINAHGYHNENHYTTAHDMVLIAREATKNPLIREVVKEIEFSGNGMGENPDPTAITNTYNFKTHNELLLRNEFYYPYATGIKTGFTDEAGDCLVASATKDGTDLISAIYSSADPGRWQNTIFLLNYGFDNYKMELVQEKDTVVDTIKINNPQLGMSETVDIYTKDSFSSFLSKDELSKIEKSITYNDEFIFTDPNVVSTETMFKTPIAANTEVGTITYTLDGKELSTGTLLIKDEIMARDLKSDFNYYFDTFKATAFSLTAIPFWVGGILVIAVIFIITKRIKNRRRRNRNRLMKRY